MLEQSQASDRANTEITATNARYEREIEDLRRLLSEARQSATQTKFEQANLQMNSESVNANQASRPGCYTRDRHRIHHLNFGGDMRFA